MASQIPNFDWHSQNVADSFALFQQRLELYFTINSTKEEQRVPILLLATGEEGIRRYNSWTLTEAEKKDTKVIFSKFSEQLEPPENFRINRLKLSKFNQKQGESLDTFVNRCKLLANKCQFTNNEHDERLIELIIASTPIPELQKELLSKGKEFKLKDAVVLRLY